MTSTTSQQPPHVVQAIFDSLTRCLNPVDSEAPFASRCPPRRSPGESSVASHRRGSTGSDRSDALKAQHDADRYIHRKLEIFRTTDEDIAEMGIDPRKARKQRLKDRSKSKGHRRNQSANTLVDSLEDEIAHRANSLKRGQMGGTANGTAQKEGPLAGLAQLLMDPLSCLGQAQKPFGLCLGTPVRSPSKEDISNLSDWRLTAEEFAARQAQQERNQWDAPDVDLSSASQSQCDGDEEETITSTLYFDQKYSHIPETSPPMPLYREQRVAVSELANDELFAMIEKWDAAGVSRGKAPHPRKGRRSSPTDQIVVKQARGTSRAATTRKGRAHHYNTVPVAKSSSVSTEPEDARGMREPDIVYVAAR